MRLYSAIYHQSQFACFANLFHAVRNEFISNVVTKTGFRREKKEEKRKEKKKKVHHGSWVKIGRWSERDK